MSLIDDLKQTESAGGKIDWSVDPPLEVIPPNRDAIAIVRLFLEKLDQLSAEERKELVAVIRFLNSPPMIVWSEKKAVWELGGLYSSKKENEL